MVQASCEGMLDYSKADLLDPKWWTKFWLTLAYLERQTDAKIEEHKFQFNLAVLDYNTADNAFDTHWRRAEQSRNRLISSIAPWATSGAKSAAESAAEMRNRWIDKWGDPAAPETKAKVQEIIDYWESTRKRKQAGHGNRI